MSRLARRTLWLASVVVCGFTATASAGENEISAAEERAGWRLLFDGETKEGWRNFKKDTIGEGWQVQEGALVRTADGAGDIVSQEQFDNFELSIDFKIAPEGNSGIMFH